MEQSLTGHGLEMCHRPPSGHAGMASIGAATSRRRRPHLWARGAGLGARVPPAPPIPGRGPDQIPVAVKAWAARPVASQPLVSRPRIGDPARKRRRIRRHRRVAVRLRPSSRRPPPLTTWKQTRRVRARVRTTATGRPASRGPRRASSPAAPALRVGYGNCAGRPASHHLLPVPWQASVTFPVSYAGEVCDQFPVSPPTIRYSPQTASHAAGRRRC